MFAQRIHRIKDLIDKSVINVTADKTPPYEPVIDDLDSLQACLSEQDFDGDVLESGYRTINSIRSLFDIYTAEMTKINKEVLLLSDEITRHIGMNGYARKGNYYAWIGEFNFQRSYYNLADVTKELMHINHMLAKLLYVCDAKDVAQLKELVAVGYVETTVKKLDAFFNEKVAAMLSSLNCMLGYAALINNALVEEHRLNSK